MDLMNRATTAPALHYLGSLAPTSRATYAGCLDRIARALSRGSADAATFPWHRLTVDVVTKLAADLAAAHPHVGTVNKYLAAVRGALVASFDLGLLTADDLSRLRKAAKSRRGEVVPRGRVVTYGEMAALFNACDKGTAGGRRDAATLGILAGAGVRVDEFVHLTLADYNEATGELVVRHGKGNRQRVVYLTGAAALWLALWLEARGREAGPLVCEVRKGGTVHLRQTSTTAVRKRLAVLAKAAGVQPFTPHDLRRTVASTLLDTGTDISTVQRVLGHASVVTTQRYDRRGERAKLRASESLHLPAPF